MDDHFYSESDVSLSPSQILERLQIIRQLQLLQRGKLQKQQLQYQETTENSSSIMELVSHFSKSTSYNTFRSLLQITQETTNEESPCVNNTDIASKIRTVDLIDGVAVLNISDESEFIHNTPDSAKSKTSELSKKEPIQKESRKKSLELQTPSKVQISLDDMPILSPKKDFEALVLEKLQNEKEFSKPKSKKKDNLFEIQNKNTFLRKGEGMSRFGLKKKDLVIQNTKSLPWRNRNFKKKSITPSKTLKINSKTHNIAKNDDIKIIITSTINKDHANNEKIVKSCEKPIIPSTNVNISNNNENNPHNFNISAICEVHNQHEQDNNIKILKEKHPLLVNKSKTWASVLTEEQNAFLTQLKQTNYYKNFTSPTKSIPTDVSCDENFEKLAQEREKAEQNMFDLLERKVANGFPENSFLNKFMAGNNSAYSGESTPMVMQKCLKSNPELFHIFPDLHESVNDYDKIEHNTYQSDYCSDTCSSVSSCCSCKTVQSVNESTENCIKDKKKKLNQPKRSVSKKKEVEKYSEEKECQSNVIENEIMKANMAEMNAKLIATSELLKERLRELEEEIETFKKENANLTKMREEIDLERQRFYEDKANFEQKFNEEKILSEYYLAEEKEKLVKQKQTYERYMREVRGRLNKKDKDEVANLKKEIVNLKEEIKVKDAKSSSIIARLRNQIKIIEKEKKALQDEGEKLKKENKRIQHSNDMTRRLTNMKYLEEINKKLNNMANKETRSEIDFDNDIKYKSYEIERQSRSRKVQQNIKSDIRPRAKSVPNLKVTSRYAKYFSQRDSISNLERNNELNIESLTCNSYDSDNDEINKDNELQCQDDNSEIDKTLSDNEEEISLKENSLENKYKKIFISPSPIHKSSNRVIPGCKVDEKHNEFFLQKSCINSNSLQNSGSPTQKCNSQFPYTLEAIEDRPKSPISILSNRSQQPSLMSINTKEIPSNISKNYSHSRSKSPISVLSNSSHKMKTVIYNEEYRDQLQNISPEPTTSKISLTKTNLNPLELKKSDGSRELRFPNGNVKHISADGKYSKFIYYNGDVKEIFYNEGRIKYYYAETKTFHTTHPDGLEVLEFPDGQVEKRYKDGSSEIRLPNGSVRYHDPKNVHIREEWRFPDGSTLTISADGEQRIVLSNGQVEVHTKDHKRREFPDGTVKLVYNDGTSETRYASGRVRIKDKHGNLIMDSAPG